MDCRADEVWKKFEDPEYYKRINLPFRTSSFETLTDKDILTPLERKHLNETKPKATISFNSQHFAGH